MRGCVGRWPVVRRGEKSRSCRLKSPACELVCEKDLGEVLFAGIAPELKSRPPKDEWDVSELQIDSRWKEEGCATRPAKFREHSLGATFLREEKKSDAMRRDMGVICRDKLFT